MAIEIPKEIKNKENRVSMIPIGIRKLDQKAHTIYVQHTADNNNGVSNDESINFVAFIS